MGSGPLTLSFSAGSGWSAFSRVQLQQALHSSLLLGYCRGRMFLQTSPVVPFRLWRMEKPLCPHQLGISISGGFRLIVELRCMWKGKYLGLGRLVPYTRDAENQPGQEGLWAVEVVSQGFGHGFGKGHADLGQCSLRRHFVP